MRNIEAKATELEGDISGMRADMEAWKTDIEDKITQSEFKDPQEEPVRDQKVHEKIKEIETKIAAWKTLDPWAVAAANRAAPGTSQLAAGESIVVFTGLGDDPDAATQLIDNDLSRMKMHPAADSYFKGEEFKGQLYYKYDNVAAATATIKNFDRAKLQLAGRSRPEIVASPGDVPKCSKV